MAEVLQNETLYDYFVDAIEDVTIPKFESSSNLSEQKIPLSKTKNESNMNIFATFMKLGNHVNAVESSDSLTSLQSQSNSNLSNFGRSEADLKSLQGIFMAMESLNLPMSESTNSFLQDSPRFGTGSNASGVESFPPISQSNVLYPLYALFVALDRFLLNQTTTTSNEQ